MAFLFEDRVASYPNRYKVTPIDGSTPYYVVLERADSPTVVGTPMNADTFQGMYDELKSVIDEAKAGATGLNLGESITVTYTYPEKYKEITLEENALYLVQIYELTGLMRVRRNEVGDIHGIAVLPVSINRMYRFAYEPSWQNPGAFWLYATQESFENSSNGLVFYDDLWKVYPGEQLPEHVETVTITKIGTITS